MTQLDDHLAVASDLLEERGFLIAAELLRSSRIEQHTILAFLDLKDAYLAAGSNEELATILRLYVQHFDQFMERYGQRLRWSRKQSPNKHRLADDHAQREEATPPTADRPL